MPKPLRIIQVALFLIVLVSGAAMIWLASRAPSPAGPAATPPPAIAARTEGMTIPAFTLIDQDGKPYTRDRLLGKLTVLDVVFTNCPLACPMMTEKMSAIADATLGTPVQFLSISIDPERDRPERLREYRKIHDITGLKADRWTHLTSDDGSDAVVRAIVEQGLKAALDEDQSRPIKAHDGSSMFNILHPTWFFLLDGRDGRDVRVLDIFQSSSDEDMVRLQEQLRHELR